MTKPRVTRTHADLVEGLEHVGYELTMTAETSALLRWAPDGVVHDALLESMLLHVRSLTDFFVYTSPRPKPTDILRTDFAPEWTPPQPEATRALAGRDALHKHLAHLTWERVDDGKQSYALAAAQDIIVIADAWSRHLAVHAPALQPVLQKSVLDAQAAVARRSPYAVLQAVTTTSS